MTGLAFRALDTGVARLFQRLDVLALRVVGAADELAVAALLDHQLTPVLRADPVFDDDRCFFFGGGLLGGFVQVAGVVAVRVAGAADKATALAEADVQRLAALRAGFVEAFGGDLGAADAFLLGNLLVESLPEAVEHRNPLALAGGDIVKLVFEPGGEVVVDVLGEVLGQELVDDLAGIGRLEALLVENHVLAILQRRDDRRIGRRPADAELFQRLHQRCFRIARRRLGEMLLAGQLVHRQHVADFQQRQLGAVLVAVGGIVDVFLVHGDKAGKGLHLAGGAEHAVTDRDVDGGGIEFCGGHLAGQRPLPDHVVQLELVGGQERLDRFRRAEDRRRAHGFVRFLGVLGLVLEHRRRFRQVVGVEVLADVEADLLDRVVGERHRVGTHVGDQTDLALADVDALVQLLRGAHGAVGGHAELAHPLLLQRRGGERCGRVARFFLLFHRRDRRVVAGQRGQHRGLGGFVGNVELLELLALPLVQLGAEFLPALVAVQMHRPVFLGGKRTDFDLALADQAQGRALHAAGGQAATDLLPQQRRQVEADQIVERTARLLGIDHVLRNFTRIGDGFQHRVAGDLVEHHAHHLLVLQELLVLEDFHQVPRNGFTLAVRVGREIDGVGFAHGGGDGVNVFRVPRDDLVLHREVVFGVDRAVLGHQIANVTIGGEYLEIGPEIFFQWLRLGRRFDDQQIGGHGVRDVKSP